MEIAGMTREQLNAVAAQLKAKLDNHYKEEAEEVPPGWFTALEMAKASGIHRRSVTKQLEKVGCQCRRFRIVMNGRIVSVHHYHL